MPAGVLKFARDGESLEIPYYDPETLSSPALRTVGPDGNVVAFKLTPTPGDTPDHALRTVDAEGNVVAIDLSTSTLLAGFESGNWPGSWTGETNHYSLTTGALVGEQAILVDEDYTYPQIANPVQDTPRGHTYSVRTEPHGPDVEAWLLTNVQDDIAGLNDCYAAIADVGQNTLRCTKRENGGSTGLESVAVSLAEREEYIVSLDVDADRVRARVSDSTGSVLAETPWHTDQTHSGGCIGIYTDGGGSSTVYDDVRQHSLGTVS